MRSQRGLLLTCIACAAACVAFLPASAAAQSVPTVTGTWSCCGSGGASAQTWTITESGTSLSGTFAAGPISGSVNGTSVEIVTGPYSYLPSYTATFLGTISADGETMSGTWSDTYGRSDETWTSTRTSEPTTKSKEEEKEKETKKAKEAEETKKKKEEEQNRERPSATFVTCYYEFLTNIDTCTAEVANANGDPVGVPTGTVRFTSTSPGVFPKGSACTLAAEAASSSVPFCSVEFLPPDSNLPSITATYSGDANHLASEGHTEFLGSPAAETTAEPGKTPKDRLPDEVNVKVDVPADGTTVDTSADTQTNPLKDPPDPDSPLGQALKNLPESKSWESNASIPAEGKVALNRLLELAKRAPFEADQTGAWNAVEDQLKKVDAISIAVAGAGTYESEELLRAQRALEERLAEIVDAITATKTGQPAQKSSLASVATAARAKKRGSNKHAASKQHTYFTLLGSAVHPNARAGRLEIKLHLNRSELRRLAGKHKRLTIYVWVRMTLPSNIVPGGAPEITVKKLRLSG